MSFETRIKTAEQLVDNGNVAMKENNWRQASFHYKQVWMYLSDFLPFSRSEDGIASMLEQQRKAEPPEKLKMEASTIYAKSQCNLAQAHLKLARYAQAHDCCEVALKLLPHESPLITKCKYRSAVALMNMDLLDEAAELFSQLDQSDPLVIDSLHVLKRKQEATKAKEQKMFSNMLKF